MRGLAIDDREGAAMLEHLKDMLVVACVAMHMVNGLLEENVSFMGQTEVINLWYFSKAE